MAGIGERMGGDGDFLFFDQDGFPVDQPGNPVPDDATLARLGAQHEEWNRRVPNRSRTPVGIPLRWRRRTPTD